MLNHSSRLPQSTPLTVCAIMGFEEVPPSLSTLMPPNSKLLKNIGTGLSILLMFPPLGKL